MPRTPPQPCGRSPIRSNSASQTRSGVRQLFHQPRAVVAAPTPGRLALLAQCEALLGIRDQDEAFGQALAAAQALSRRARPAMIVRPAAGNRENRPRP